MLKAERLERAYTLFAMQRVITRLTMEDRGRISRDEQAWLRHLASFPQENPNPVVEVDASGALVYANPAALRLFPDLPAEGSRHPLLAGLGRYALEMKIPGAGSLAFEAEVRGAVYRLDVSVPRPGEGLRVYATDITEQKRAEEALAHRASHDPLTGLANRDLFEERVRQALARAARHGRKAAVLFVDLDDFKAVNDAFGHRVGDRLLAEVAGRLKDGVMIEDTVSRLGGDEFVVLLEDLAREDEALLVARRVGEMLRPSLVLGGRTLAVTASIGAALGPSGDPLGQDLISEADVAMYRAKQSGKDRQELFRPT